MAVVEQNQERRQFFFCFYEYFLKIRGGCGIPKLYVKFWFCDFFKEKVKVVLQTLVILVFLCRVLAFANKQENICFLAKLERLHLTNMSIQIFHGLIVLRQQYRITKKCRSVWISFLFFHVDVKQKVRRVDKKKITYP